MSQWIVILKENGGVFQPLLQAIDPPAASTAIASYDALNPLYRFGCSFFPDLGKPNLDPVNTILAGTGGVDPIPTPCYILCAYDPVTGWPSGSPQIYASMNASLYAQALFYGAGGRTSCCMYKSGPGLGWVSVPITAPPPPPPPPPPTTSARGLWFKGNNTRTF